jgi:hypothetical protein
MPHSKEVHPMKLDLAAAPKALFDLCAEEITMLNSMENWGTTLSLTFIVLLGRQIIEWSSAAQPPQLLTLGHWSVYLAPALVGLVGFIFLRVVNYRIRGVRRRQYALIGDFDDGRAPKGPVGWFMALMPLGAGLSLTTYLAMPATDVCIPLLMTFGLSVASVFVAGYLFHRQSIEPQPGVSTHEA